MNLAQRMIDLDTFLAYAVALEEEAAERHGELADMMDVHNNPEVAATMNSARALEIAMRNERRAHDFYAAISRESPDAGVRALAAEFAEEEQEHLALLDIWLAKVPESADEVAFDPDPPHMPE
jgi:rubrerythrin